MEREGTCCQGLRQEKGAGRFFLECENVLELMIFIINNHCTTLQLYQNPLDFIFRDTFPSSLLCLKSIFESESYSLAQAGLELTSLISLLFVMTLELQSVESSR